mmetsp:Transcript_55600/g.120028  ORF Transcript_55600/g.120028 Transcript_55600/m.120028 type:complete len:850 (-) Transcript_55600:55-2604(-)|eukprot:CAMPEP_0170582802 /NCGR_PEP_ID=MMETSP0224-20130122/7783_1 /TAXON_ID=285029 /ORGANISM="Togula jolla, Strain CCCM 725" /LENGTH=849 /DNA_ID=CAMNT_0010906061 /DNA_START=48 /DNA_END=2597 /DNA_ORIENTATION=+
MSLLQAEEDEEGEAALDEPVALVTNLEKARQRIIELLNVKQRESDYQKRLERKLGKLDADLAQKREEVESLQRTLRLAKNKKREQLESDQKEHGQKAEAQAERIRDQLSEVLYRKPPSLDKQKESFQMDTVLVSFIRPNESIRYNLTFRINNDTTIFELRDEVCKYWGVNVEDYILKTMANSKCQRELKVKDCFKQGEIAQLRLEVKRRELAEVTEAELKAIQAKKPLPRTRGQRVAYNKDGVERIQKFTDNYASQLKKMGGIYFLLKRRDSKPSEHSNKIKLRDFIVYIALAVLTFYTYTMRRPQMMAYWQVKGIEDALLVEVNDPNPPPDAYWSHVPKFTDVSTRDEVWWWLSVSLPAIIWNDANLSLRTYNLMAGYVSIRTQRVRGPCLDCELWATCDDDNEQLLNLVKALPGATCLPVNVDDDTQETANDLNLKAYWDYVTSVNRTDQPIRGPALPWKWVSDEVNREKGMGTIEGKFASYDASGYSAEYRMVIVDPVLELWKYDEDMLALRDNYSFIDARTRFVAVSFTTYNFQYDLWTAIDLIFEMTPGGGVIPSYTVRPFSPTFGETTGELMNSYLDVGRLIIGVYIFVFIGIAERKHKQKNHKAGFLYHTSLNGLTDLGIVACITIVVIYRIIKFSYETNERMSEVVDRVIPGRPPRGFTSSMHLASVYETLFVLEGVAFLLIMYRLLSLLRLNHTVYLLWHTLGEALKAFAFFVAMFLPALVAFVLLAKSVWGGYLEKYRTFSLTSLQIYKLMRGQMNTRELQQWNSFWSTFLAIVFFVVITFLLLNVFTAIFVDAYYVVKLTSHPPPEKWDAQRLYTWAMPALFISVINNLCYSSTSEAI